MASVINNAFSAFSSYTFRTFRIVSIWNRKLESEKLQNLKLANTFASHHSLHIFCLLFRCASWHRNFQLKFKNPKMQQEHKFFRLVFSVLAKRPSKRNEQKSQTKINEWIKPATTSSMHNLSEFIYFFIFFVKFNKILKIKTSSVDLRCSCCSRSAIQSTYFIFSCFFANSQNKFSLGHAYTLLIFVSGNVLGGTGWMTKYFCKS